MSRVFLKALGVSAALGGMFFVNTSKSSASDDAVHPPNLVWSHYGAWSGFDYHSVRRGFEVYRNVCASCHSLERITWGNLVETALTEKEAKEFAADTEYPDDPDAQGEPRTRAGKLSDKLPAPYPNEQAARAANNGALPPDLSLMVKARHSGLDYLFFLLTSYVNPPAGSPEKPGLHFNPYFPGGWIAMTQALHADGVEYEDGTPASISQMAKDVSIFLNWAAEPEHDVRKRTGIKVMVVLGVLGATSFYWSKTKWVVPKLRRVVYNNPTH